MAQIIKVPDFLDNTDTVIPEGSACVGFATADDGTFILTVQPPTDAQGDVPPPIVIEGCTHPHHAPKLV